MSDWRNGISESLKKFGLHRLEKHSPSRAYERYFENYEETRENGRVVRRYLGDHRLRPGSAKGHLWRSIGYFLLWAVSAGMLVFCAMQPIDANRIWYAALPQALSLFALGWCCLGVIHYFMQPARMELRQYRESSLTLLRTSLPAAAALALLAVAYLVSGARIWALPALGGALCALLLWILERRLDYPLEKSEYIEVLDED